MPFAIARATTRRLFGPALVAWTRPEDLGPAPDLVLRLDPFRLRLFRLAGLRPFALPGCRPELLSLNLWRRAGSPGRVAVRLGRRIFELWRPELIAAWPGPFGRVNWRFAVAVAARIR